MDAPPSIATTSRSTLEAVAARLVRLEPEDTRGLADLRSMLAAFVATCEQEALLADVAEPARQVLAAADALVAGEPEASLDELARRVEAAQRAADLVAEAALAAAVAGQQDEADLPVSTRSEALAPVAEASDEEATVVEESVVEESTRAAPAAQLIPEPVSTGNAAYEALLMKPDVLSTDVDADLVEAFVIENRETLALAEAALLQLEQDPEHAEAINTIFRAFHTIKGTSAFLGLTRMTDLAHEAENLLSRMRDGALRCAGRNADLVLRSIDVLRACTSHVGETKPGQSVPLTKGIGELREELIAARAAPAGSDGGTANAQTESRPAAAARREGDASDGGASESTSTSQGTETSVRVRTDRLDRLVDMVGELVIAQSLVAQDDIVRSGAHQALQRKTTHAGKIVRELQDLSMSLRMLPLRATFQKMSRIVRDAARRTGKKVRFVSQGDDTEVDRNMVDVVGDPLVHMVRNAVDHGLEPPAERVALGKPEEGTVCLRAYHAGGHVVIEIQEDGRGLDRNRIVAKAIEKGLIESGDGMSDQEVYQLLFKPGFSTAAVVTEMSGRGVGLDVVKRNVESLKGRIGISTQLGKGSTFSLHLPLTLAITDGMLVRVGPQRYVVPTTAIRQSLRPKRDEVVGVDQRGQMLRLRGEVLPIHPLGALLGIADHVTDPTRGLLVDELLGQQQVVTKPLGDLKQVPGVSGGAILGDGTVGLILDPPAIARLADEHRSSGQPAPARAGSHEPAGV